MAEIAARLALRFSVFVDLAGMPKKPRKMKEAQAVETEPDAWERFEKAIHKIAPPKKAKVKDNSTSDQD